MSKDIALEQSVDDFLKWLNFMQKQIEKDLNNANRKTENNYHLKGMVDCLKMVNDSCRAYGLNEMGGSMKDFDVNIMVNIVAGSFDEAVDKLDDVFKTLDTVDCEYRTEIREVGEYTNPEG